MKKLVSVLCAVLLLLTLAVPAAATEATASVPRGELAKMINEAYNLYTSDGHHFMDMNPAHPYAYEMMTAHWAGYLSGYPDGSGKPDAPVTRLEAAVMLGRAIDLPPQDAPLSCTDAADIPDWAAESVRLALANGLFTLTPTGAFDPNALLTREAAEQALAAATALVGLPWSSKLIETTAHDGVALTGRLCLPTDETTVEKVVLLINGTGPTTYESKGLQLSYRFKYYDYFADEFAKDKVAFFSYNTRGIHMDEDYPFYTIDWDAYNSYTPQNCAKDVVSFIKALKKEDSLKNAEIILLGWSEGAVIAPLAALEPDNGIDALLLAGYPDMNMKDILVWQLDGAQTLFYYTLVFDAVGQDHITKEQYEADPYRVIGGSPLVYDMTFDELDSNKNGKIDLEDFSVLSRAELHKALLAAVERDDTDWIVENFMTLPAGWFKAHFALGRTGDILAKVNPSIPIHIFHGTVDLNCPVQGVYDVEAQFKAAGLTNLTTHVFEGQGHNLGYDYWLVYHEATEAYEAIFQTVREF